MFLMNYDEFYNKVRNKELKLEKFSTVFQTYSDIIYEDDNLVFKNKESSINIENIKEFEHRLIDILNNCVYNIIKKKKDEKALKEMNELDSYFIATVNFIYKFYFYRTRDYLLNIYERSNKLKDLTKIQNFHFRYRENIYRSKDLKHFDKIRFLYQFATSKENINSIHEIYKIYFYKDGSELIYSMYNLLSKTDNLLDTETKRRLYIEFGKLFNDIMKTAYQDSLIYYVLYGRMKEKYLYNLNFFQFFKRKKKSLYNITTKVE